MTTPAAVTAESSPASVSRRFLFALLAIAMIALAVRVGYVLGAKSGEPPVGDQIYYNAQANTNADGNWFQDAFDGQPTAEHPPLTALVLTPVSWVSARFDDRANNVMAHRLTMALIGVLVVVVIGVLGRTVCGERAGIVAAAIAALSPNLWINDGLIMSETLATLAVALALLLTYRFIRRPTMATAVVTGLACGLAAMARQELLLLLPVTVLPVILLTRTLPPRKRVALATGAVLATVAVAGPWVVWNLTRFDEPATFSTNDGITICGANHPRTWYGSGTGLWALDCALYKTPEGDRSVTSSALRDRGFEYASDHLERLPIVVVARVARVWSLYAPGQMATYNTGEGREEWASWLAFAAWWLMVPFAGLGIVNLRRRRVRLWPLLSQFVIVTITAAVIYGLLRFRIPAEISLIVLAGAGLEGPLARITAPGREGTPPVHSPPDPELVTDGGR